VRGYGIGMINDFSPKYINFECVRKLCLQIDIKKNYYQLCEDAACDQWNNKKKGKYGNGIINSKVDPYKVERIGLLGEVAIGRLFHTPINTTYTEYGEKHDFKIKGITLDVKTASKPGSTISYIYAGKNSEQRLSIRSDVYVCCRLESEDREKQKASILLVGWEHKSFIKHYPTCPSRVPTQTHYNYELHFKRLRPISDLYILLGEFHATKKV